MGLNELYQSLEDKYYNFMDGLENAGIKVYEWFINPLEDHGMPSMPFFFLGVLLVLGIGAFAIMSILGGGLPGTAGSVNIAIKVSGPDSANLEGILVKLSAGEEQLSAQTKNGVANFQDVPYAAKVTVRIDAPGYKAVNKEFPLASGRKTATFSVPLESDASAVSSVVLFVADDNQFPLGEAEVRFQDPLTGEFVIRKTDPQGRVTLSVPSSSSEVTLSVSHEGYERTTQSCLASVSSCSVILYASGGGGGGPEPTAQPSVQPQWATVRVEVLDMQGNGLAGRVTLYRNDNAETLDVSTTDGEGVVRFENIPLGVDIYATFDPDSTDFTFHTFDAKIATASTDFFVQLPKKTCTVNCGTNFASVTIEAVDPAANPVPGAQVRLYLSQAAVQAVSDVLVTGDDGKAVFDIAPTARVYGTVWAEGYLPAQTRVLTGGEQTKQKLEKVLIGNHGSLNVSVVDDTGTVVSGATVNLYTHDGFPLGVPSQDTDLDGTTVFENLPLKRVKAVAVYGAQNGNSDIVEISLASRSMRIELRPATAFVSAKAFDATNQSAIRATFVAVLSSSNRVVGTCQSNGTACSIEVPASRNLVLFANASGYVTLSSEEFSVDAGSTLHKSMSLLPSSLSNQLTVLSYAVSDENGRNVTALDKGRIYSFSVSFNLPSNAQKSGVFLRVGTQADAAQSIATFGHYSQPSAAEVVKGARFNPGPSCTDDLGDQSGPIQWIDWTYSQFGSSTVSANVFVKPDAKPKDEVVLQYRVYAKAGDVYIRKPDDARFGGAEKTSELDSCYAQTFTIKLPVIDGKSDCNDRACLSTRFYSNQSTAANGLRVDVGSTFNVSIDLRAFETLDAPRLSITTSPSVQITGYDFGTLTPVSPASSTVSIPLSFFQRANGTLFARALVPTASSRFNLVFSDTPGTILDVPRFVVVQGTGTFVLVPSPTQIEALQDNTLTVDVKSDRNVPVTDARLTLKETQGSPFEGFPNEPISIQGDGSKDNGQGGKYKFKKLKPHTPGLFAVVATRDGFQEGEVQVAVNATEPLEFGQDISNVALDCKTPTTLTVSSRVNAELKVAAAFSGTACASLRVLSTTAVSASPVPSSTSSGSSSANFRVKSGKDTRILLTPTTDGECFLAFNTQTLTGQALGNSIAVLSSQCGLTPTPTPTLIPGNASPSPSPSPAPGSDCAARGGQCVQLGQSCPSGFVPSTYQQSQPTWPQGYTPYSNVPGYPYGGSPYGSGYPSATPTPSASVQAAAACTEGSQCCVPVSQVCQAPNFNFQNIFSKYLGYYLGAQTLGNYPQQVTAASAPTQLMATQGGVTLKKSNSGCSQSGNGISCTKPIYPIVPYNAMAFSVENQLFNTVDILTQYNNPCYEIQEVGKFSGVNDIFSDIKQTFQSQVGLLTRQTRTFVVTFRPRAQCVQYTVGQDGQVTVEPIGKGKDGFQVKLRPIGSGVNIDARDFTVHFAVEQDQSPADYLSFIAMPSGSVTLRGGKDAVSFEEPAVFANNIQYKPLTFTVNGAGLSNFVLAGTESRAATLKLTKDAQLSLQVGTSGKTATSLPLQVSIKTAPDGLKSYDVVGNVGASEGALSCSGANYCTPEQVTEYLEKVKTDLNEFAGQYVASIDTLAYEDPLGLNGGEGSAYQQLYQQAMRDALREYMGLRSQYDACVAQGQDPLSNTRQQCQQSGIAPIYNYNQNQPGYYNQQGFSGGYNPYGGGYGGGIGGGAAINPALGGGQVPYNPYSQNFYPGPGYSPGYVNDPNLQQSFGNAFGQGWQQAGCNSDILNAFQYQGQLGMGYFNPFQQQLQQQYGYSRGVYSNRQPVIKDLQPVIALPVKEAGNGGGIKVYQIKADLTGASSDAVEFRQFDRLNSDPRLWSTSTSGSSASLPKGSQSVKEKYLGFPYLKASSDGKNYEIQNWLGKGATTVQSNAPKPAPAAAAAAESKTVGGTKVTPPSGAPVTAAPQAAPQGPAVPQGGQPPAAAVPPALSIGSNCPAGSNSLCATSKIGDKCTPINPLGATGTCQIENNVCQCKLNS